MKLYNIKGFKTENEHFSFERVEARVTKDKMGITLSLRLGNEQITIQLDQIVSDINKMETI